MPASASLAVGFKARGFSTSVRDRKSTRLNSSHLVISYAVFCLKKKLTRREIRDHDRKKCRRENNESALRAPGQAPARKLLHHSRGEASVVNIGRLITQSRIEQIIERIVHFRWPRQLAFSSISRVRARHSSSPFPAEYREGGLLHRETNRSGNRASRRCARAAVN